MQKIYAVIEERSSEFGREVVEFTVSDEHDDNAVLGALEQAHEELEENSDGVNEDTCSEEITMMIVDRAAEILGGKAAYVNMVEFEYEFDWNNWEKKRKED